MSSASLPPGQARAADRERLRRETFDLAIIGGGITGAGIARDAALRGFRAALLERGDFASGTSSRSARLAHGGLRYVEMLQFGVVRQACAERQILDRLAPHQVTPIAFTLPVYEKFSRYLKVRLGTWIYDRLGANLRPTEGLSVAQLTQVEPAIRRAGCLGAARYYERRVDDARLTLSTVLAARGHGALALNYAAVEGLLKSNGRLAGVAVRDQLTGETFEVRARLVVNASGAWNDQVRGLDAPGQAPGVRPNKGIHVIVPRARLPIHGVVDFPPLEGRRMLYAVPWRHTVLLGTTDADYAGDLDAVHAAADEVAWILASANHAFLDVHLTSAEVLSTFAGLRPLARGEMRAAYRATREHQIAVSGSGLISIVGGKLTTHRAMAQDVVDLAARELGGAARCRTAELPLEAGPALVGAALPEAARAAADLDEETARYLVEAYGARSLEVLRLATAQPALRRPLVAGLPYLWAEVAYAVDQELACTLSDVLIRRTRVIHEDRNQGLPQAAEVARWMGSALGWEAAEVERQVADYRRAVAATHSFDPAWAPPL